MLNGIMINTSGKVQGKIIIDNPARYAITSHDGYDALWPAPTAISPVSEKITPRNINENSVNAENTRVFFAVT
jgi:hypothetical protein